MRSIAATMNGLTYCINQNLELVAIVMLLSESYYSQYPYLKTVFPSEYLRKAELYFENYRHHPAVRLFDELETQGLNFHFPLVIQVDHSPKDSRYEI